MKFDGTDWVPVGQVGFSAGKTDGTTLAFSPLGEPYVGYADSAIDAKATVMKFDGAGWVTVGAQGFSAGKPSYTSLAFSQTGIPYLAFTDVGNSHKATVMKYDAPAGIKESKEPGLSLYPNPATNQITVKTTMAVKESYLAISDIEGQRLITKPITGPKTLIDITNLQAGIYFVQLINSRTVNVGKIVKE
jgi:hypothetical protein